MSKDAGRLALTSGYPCTWLINHITIFQARLSGSGIVTRVGHAQHAVLHSIFKCKLETAQSTIPFPSSHYQPSPRWHDNVGDPEIAPGVGAQSQRTHG